MRLWPSSGRARLVLIALVVGAAATAAAVVPREKPEAPLATVTRGDFTEILETRGEIRPLRSVVVTAPFQAGELLILELVPTGTMVKKGDPVAKFDAMTLRRTLQDREAELRQARADIAEAAERAKIQAQSDATGVWRAENDVQRAKLDVGDPSVMSLIETERSQLAVGDAEQRLTEAQIKERATRQSAAADLQSRQRKVAKLEADVAYTKRALENLEIKAPADGMVSVMYNYRSGSMVGGGYSEFRPGDRAYAGAQILELPDLSSVHLAARIDEGDRGQIKIGQTAVVRLDAVPDREYQGKVEDISLLARVDYTSWPATKNFDLKLAIVDPDARLRPGMSAVARIATGRLPDMLLVPAGAVFAEGGRPVVYRQTRGGFETVSVEIVRRGRDQVALKGVGEGDRLRLTPPDDAAEAP